MAIVPKINSMINKANSTTGKTDTDLTAAIQSLVDGYGKGGDLPTETLEIKDEGVYNVTNYATADVDIDMLLHISRPHNLDPADWVRPAEWQPMANGYETGQQLYMVYDTELLPENAMQFACWYATTSSSNTNIKVERGYVDDSGNYQVVSSTTFARSTSFVEDLPDIGQRYLVYRITPNGSGNITSFMHDRPTTAYHPTITGSDYYGRICQPMIEAYGSLPYVTAMYASIVRGWSAWYEVHHDIRNMTALTSCASLFRFGEKLECIDGLTTWDTTKVTSFANMFDSCRILQYVDLSNLIVTNKATSLASMFSNCHLLSEINTENWDISNVTSLASVFNNCYNLETLDTSNFVSSKVTRIDTMFYCCYKIRKIDLSGVSTPNYSASTTLANVFANCVNAQKIDISGLITTGNTSCATMFTQCGSLRELKIGPGFNTASVTTMASMFSYCYNLKDVSFVSQFNTAKVATFSNMFRDCRLVEKIDLSNFSTAVATNFEAFFQNCYNLRELILPDNFVTSKATTLANTFNGCYCVPRINTTGWNTQNVTTMASTFNMCRKLVDCGNVADWNYDKVTTMASMFANCNSLPELPDYSNKTFLKVTTWANIFDYCASVKEIHLDNISFPALTTLAYVFRGCYEARSVYLDNWNIPLVTTVTYAFSYLSKCHTISITNWNAPKLSVWSYIFYYCYSLRNLDCALTFTQATSTNAFGYCYSLENITNFPTIGKVATTINNSTIITSESWDVIFAALPTNTTALKLTIGATNIAQLTDAQKAVATSKMWTLA